jgi:hypothetical protein
VLQSFRARGTILVDIEVILKHFNKVPSDNPKVLSFKLMLDVVIVTEVDSARK